MKELGIKPESVSGICASVDWVTAAQNSGFTAVSGVVDYCMKSLPIAKCQPTCRILLT